MSAETLSISDVCKRLGRSDSTIRKQIRQKSIPQPIKRKNNSEALRWRTSDIDKFLKSTIAANDENFNDSTPTVESMTADIFRKIIREELAAFAQELNQTPRSN